METTHNLSCIYYPTTIIIVDDNNAFLENIQLKLGGNTLCKTFNDPEKAITYIKQTTRKDEILKNVIGIDMESEHYSHLSSQLPLQFDISKLYKQIYNNDRFNEISVAVVDFEMPNMDGKELSKKIRDTSIKIIMLTGEADEPMAIKLFNEGVIDKFLRKGQPGLYDDLKNSIAEMQKGYFHDLTYPIVKGLASDEDSSLGDPVFTQLFEKICRDVSASCYFLIELSGSFLLLDNEGSPTWLIIKTLSQLEEIAAQLEETNLSSELVEAVRKGERVAYFANFEDIYSKNFEFEKHLFKAEKLKGKTDYRYSLTKKLPDFSFEKDKILSFNEYISKDHK